MNSRSIPLVVLVASFFVFTSQVRKMDALEQEATKLLAEYDAQYSWSNIGASTVRAFFDGATMGTYAQNGMLTEYRKLEQFEAYYAKRQAELITSYDNAKSTRRWAFISGLTALGVIVFRKFKKPSASPVEGQIA